MNEKLLRNILRDKKELESLVNFFKKKKLLFEGDFSEFEIKGHLEKSKNNLRFVKDIKKLKYFDWVVTGCYYSVYHAVLALILSKGYSSKNHDASLSILIKEFYEDFVSEVEFVNKLFINYGDVTFYVSSKEKRELASYSSNFVFSEKEVDDLIKDSIKFVNKVEEILDGQEKK